MNIKKWPWAKIWFVFVVTSPITLPLIWVFYQCIALVFFFFPECGHGKHPLLFKSPNSKIQLFIEEINCGATTPFVGEFSLIEKGITHKKKVIMSIHGSPDFVPIKVKWSDSKHLGIHLPKDVEIYHQEKEWQGIHIRVDKDLPPVFTEEKNKKPA
jgi:hypothetical protein